MPPSTAFLPIQSAVSPIFESDTGSSPVAPPLTSASTSAPVSHLVEISFDDLSEFEIVQNQYSAWGVCFHNAIALQPTNSSFQIDRMGIMPMGSVMKLTIAFDVPPQQVRLVLTGASLIHATLLDQNRYPILYPVNQQRLLPTQAALPPSASRRSTPDSNSVDEPIAFSQYELDFSASQSCPEESPELRSKNSQPYQPQPYPAQPYPAQLHPAQLHSVQLHEIELQSASPFVLKRLAIERSS